MAAKSADRGHGGSTGLETRAFDGLSFEEQKGHLFDVARRALPLWGWPSSSPLKLLNITENATFKVTSPTGRQPMVMRVHRLDYASRESISFELEWIEELRRSTDLSLAAPIAGTDGSYVQSVATPSMDEVRNVVCFTFAEGRAPTDSTDDTEGLSGVMATLGKIPNFITFPFVREAAIMYDYVSGRGSAASKMSDRDAWLYSELGRAAAIMRARSVEWLPEHRREAQARISWDWDATFGMGWNNYYGKHYWDRGSTLSYGDISTLDRALGVMYKRLEAFGRDPSRYGIVHTDLRMANLLVDGDKLTILDFDDCGLGWYLFDIAGMVGFMEHRGDLNAVIDAILSGYEKVWPLSVDEKQEIPTFILMRRIGLLEALMYHASNTEPGEGESAEITPDLIAFYAKGTVALAKRYLKSMKLAPLARPAGEDASPAPPVAGGSGAKPGPVAA